MQPECFFRVFLLWENPSTFLTGLLMHHCSMIKRIPLHRQTRTLIFILQGLLCCTTASFAHTLYAAAPGFSPPKIEQIITGKVVSSDGEALPGVTIVEQGTTNGTVTDYNGAYSLKASDAAKTLEFSLIGYVKQRIDIGARKVIDVVLEQDLNKLSEIIIVGYGVEQKALLTGAIGEIKSDDLKDLPVATLDGIMQGQAAGVQVVQNSGTPGAQLSVRIRGVSSIGGSSQPLYVVDGIPVTTGDFAQVGYEGQGINALSDLSPNDIASISILKDAAAAAIYGARASNGVVLITTKRGKSQKSVVNFNAYYGIQQAWKTLDMLDAREWMLYRNDLSGSEVFSPDDINNIRINTDWQDVIFQTAPISNYELSSTGGNDKTKIFLSGNLFEQKGIVIGTNYRRLNGRVNVDHKMSDKLTVGTSIGLTYSKMDRVEGDQTLHGPLPNGISTPAIFPVYNEDGSYNQDGPYSNAVSIANEAINQNFSFRSVANIFADYNILPGLTFSTKWGADFLNFREHAYESIKTVQGAKFNGLGFETYTNVLNLVSNNLLKYQKSIDQHSMEVLVGYSFEKYQSRSSFIRGQDFADPSLEYLNSATTIVSASSSGSDNGLRSYFARANYNFDDKYLLTFSGRIDGSSRFGENNRNGFFPAVSVGWRISQEEFFKANAISELKLRGSYGLTGNDDIPAFLFAELYGITAYGGQPGIYPSNIPNPNLKWESTTQMNIGLDLGLFDNKIVLSADFYNKQTKDLLLARPVPTSSGFGTVTENVGEVENKGVEMSLTTDNLSGRALTWVTRINFSLNRNKVLKLYGGQPIDDLGRGSNRIQEGEPIGIFYSYESLGVDPSTGDIVYADKNFDGVLSTADRTKVGNPHPDFIGGITNNLSYKRFDLSIFFQGSY
ncbi:MAG: TonB-dependent receptor, partial [Saprospiraceae bacterium]|nr:TonB-dependent receptor [Saprospiraceae bacterium]